MSAKKLVASEPQKIQLPARGAYGNLDSEQGGTRSALFTFQRAGREALLLHYTPGNIPSADRFILLINQQPVSYAPGCRGVWAVEERLILPEHHLKFGENTLEFRDRSPDLPAERWGIRDVYLTILGKDAIQAESPADLLETATRLFGERATYPGNLSRARKILDRAITLWKIRRESVSSQAVQLSRAIATAEALLISDALSRAKGMVSLGNRKQALAVYEELLAELDDPMDSRRAEVVRLIKELRR